MNYIDYRQSLSYEGSNITVWDAKGRTVQFSLREILYTLENSPTVGMYSALRVTFTVLPRIFLCTSRTLYSTCLLLASM